MPENGVIASVVCIAIPVIIHIVLYCHLLAIHPTTPPKYLARFRHPLNKVEYPWNVLSVKHCYRTDQINSAREFMSLFFCSLHKTPF